MGSGTCILMYPSCWLMRHTLVSDHFCESMGYLCISFLPTCACYDFIAWQIIKLSPLVSHSIIISSLTHCFSRYISWVRAGAILLASHILSFFSKLSVSSSLTCIYLCDEGHCVETIRASLFNRFDFNYGWLWKVHIKLELNTNGPFWS